MKKKDEDIVMLNIEMPRDKRAKFIGTLRLEDKTAKGFLMQYVDAYLKEKNLI